MPNNLKKEIENEFDKEKNYSIIISKVKGGGTMKTFKTRYIVAPICAIVVAIIGIGYSGVIEQNGNEDSRWSIKKVYIDTQVESALAIVPRWDEMSISQQFSEVEYSNSRYSSRVTQISSDYIEKNVGTAILTGFDTYSDTYHNKTGELYTIKGLSEKCVIAVKFEGTTDYYVYVNSYYRPETLGDFMQDLQLKEIVSFGTVHYDYFERDSKGNNEYVQVEFPNVSDEIIWQMLCDDLTVKNVHNDNEWHDRVMSVSVDIPLLGYKNIGISVSEDGYLTTNILDTGKTFYIGQDKVQKFVNYVIDNYEGFKIVYVDKNGNEIIEEEEDKAVEDKIVVMYNISDGTTTPITIDTNNSTGNINYTEPYNPNE